MNDATNKTTSLKQFDGKLQATISDTKRLHEQAVNLSASLNYDGTKHESDEQRSNAVYNRLIVHTNYPETVRAILYQEDLAELYHLPTHVTGDRLEVQHPDDTMSQPLAYWLGMAQVCKLITGWVFQERGKQL